MRRHVHQRDEVYERVFGGCVAGDECDPRSHGNIVRKYRCRLCGAYELRNLNGAHETSGWFFPDDDAHDPCEDVAFLAECVDIEDF